MSAGQPIGRLDSRFFTSALEVLLDLFVSSVSFGGAVSAFDFVFCFSDLPLLKVITLTCFFEFIFVLLCSDP